MSNDITMLLRQWRAGEVEARDALFNTVYDALRALAVARLSGGRGDQTLRPTSLVHEAMVRMLGGELDFSDRSHFFALAALKMRAVLVDHARACNAAKRGGGALNVTLSHVDLAMIDSSQDSVYDVLALHQALESLAAHDPRSAHAVEMMYFGGMSHGEIATVLQVSVPTVERDLRFARAWLNRQLA